MMDYESLTMLRRDSTEMSENRTMTPDPAILDEMVRRMVETVHPLRIVLFGSAARGEMGPNSDLDTLVVMPDGCDCHEVTKLLIRRLRGLGCGTDVVVVRQVDVEKFRKGLKVGGSADFAARPAHDQPRVQRAGRGREPDRRMSESPRSGPGKTAAKKPLPRKPDPEKAGLETRKPRAGQLMPKGAAGDAPARGKPGSRRLGSRKPAPRK